MHNLFHRIAFLSLRTPSARTAPRPPEMDIELNWTTCFAVAGYVAANPAVRQALGWARHFALSLISAIKTPSVKWKRAAVPASVIALVVLALFAQLPAAAQMRRGRYGTTPAGSGTDPALSAAVATFDGTLRVVTKKDFTVDLDNGNTVVFKIGKKTEFYVGTKSVKPKDLAVESVVKVEGVKDGFGVLTATKVTVKQDADTPQ
jgi:hypothetical protein